ncbi:hypothetical protein ACFUVW_20570, partial [Isoptericola sp. NPDC057391]
MTGDGSTGSAVPGPGPDGPGGDDLAGAFADETWAALGEPGREAELGFPELAGLGPGGVGAASPDAVLFDDAALLGGAAADGGPGAPRPAEPRRSARAIAALVGRPAPPAEPVAGIEAPR